MGLDRFNKTPCGFCFVEYYTHQDALDCLKYIGGTKLDERIIRADLDPGFEEGRQFGYVMFKVRFVDQKWLTLLADEANLVDKCATNTAKNTTRAVVDMVAPMTSSASARKTNMAPGGRLGHNGTVLAQPSNGVIQLVVNQLAKKQEISIHQIPYLQLSVDLWSHLLRQLLSFQHSRLHLAKPPCMDSCVARQLRVEAGAEHIALSHCDYITNFLIWVDISTLCCVTSCRAHQSGEYLNMVGCRCFRH
jgi:hypothetical protein